MKSSFTQLLSPFRMIIISYVIAIIVFSTLLYLPISQQADVHISYQDALFTAVSAVSVTGLTVINVSETFNLFGTIILALAIQLGGIGIMTLGTFVWLLFGKKIVLSQRLLIMVDQNQNNFSGLVSLMRGILLVALIIELIGAVVLGTYFLKYFDAPFEAYYNGAFAALSAFTNAGFDITGESLMPFAQDYFVLIIVALLIFAGAIGFPVLMELKEYFSKRTPNFRFSLFTKITTLTYFGVFIIGMIGIWLLELGHSFYGLDFVQQFFYSFFYSATARSAGLSIIEVSNFQVATLLFISGLMIIGASPSSAGGGIRTTTFAIMLLTIYNFALGRSDVKVFGREIHPHDQKKSFIVLSVFMLLSFISIIMICAFESSNDISLIAIIFETASAFGTCGLSLGITNQLSFPSQIILMLLMFIGRIGLVAFLFSIRRKETKSFYKYPTERIIIG